MARFVEHLRKMRWRGRSGGRALCLLLAGFLTSFCTAGTIVHGQDAPGPDVPAGRQDPMAEKKAAPSSEEPAPQWAEIRILAEDQAKEMSRVRYRIRRMTDLQGENAKVFDDFFTQFFLPQFTQVEHLKSVPALRDELTGFYRSAISRNNFEAVKRLNDLIYDEMLRVARGTIRVVGRNGAAIDVVWNGNPTEPRYWRLDGREIPAGVVVERTKPESVFHPAVRFNAMLLIGDLNDKMQVKRGVIDKDSVEPMVRALGPMIDVAGDPGYPDPVRLAAMVGIRRHARDAKLPPGARERVAGTALKIAGTREAPPERSAAGHLWIRRKAVDLLASCGVEGPDQVVTKSLQGLVADRKEELPLRLAAAEALGKIHIEKPKPGAATEMTKQLGTLAVDVADYELGTVLGKQPPFSRRRAAGGFHSVLSALGAVGGPPDGAPNERAANSPVGVLAIATDSEKPFVKGLADQVGELQTACATPTVPEFALMSKLESGSKQLGAFITAGPAAAGGSRPQRDESAPAVGPAANPPAGGPIDDAVIPTPGG